MKSLKYISVILAIAAAFSAAFSSSIEIDLSLPWLQVVGNIHPLLLHLPIGGLSFVILIELSKKLGLAKADNCLLYFILVFTSLFASASFFTGFVLAKQGGYPSELLNNHLWCAAVYVCFLALCAVLKQRTIGGERRSWLYSLSIIGGCVSMGLTGHYGGLMSHGDPLAPLFFEAEEVAEITKPTEELLVFKEVVHPILKAKCYSCHGNGKSKGELSLNSYEELLKGGKDAGKTLIPGDEKRSLLISSLMHPMEDDKHMPPAKQTQLSAGEISILTWWVSAGAQRDITVADAQAPSEIVTAVTELVPEEVRQRREIERLQKIAQKKKNAKQQRIALNKEIKKNVPGNLQPMLRFVSPYNANIHFSSVSQQGQFSDADFANFKGIDKHFTAVDLSYSSITSTTIKALSACQSIHSLRLANTKISVADVAQLSKLQSLSSLSLHSTDINSTALEYLSKMKSLRQLYLWSTKVTPAEIEVFKKNHPEIQVVY
jgi:mono/diheme cytochrome c family protein